MRHIQIQQRWTLWSIHSKVRNRSRIEGIFTAPNELTLSSGENETMNKRPIPQVRRGSHIRKYMKNPLYSLYCNINWGYRAPFLELKTSLGSKSTLKNSNNWGSAGRSNQAFLCSQSPRLRASCRADLFLCGSFSCSCAYLTPMASWIARYSACQRDDWCLVTPSRLLLTWNTDDKDFSLKW